MRRHRLDDFAQSYAMWSNPEVTRFISGKPSTEQQAWSRLFSYAGHWALLGFGYWVIEESATERFVGEIGFADFKRDIAPSMRGVPELGFVLAPEFHGKGYATESVRAALGWLKNNLNAPRTVCLIDPENAASIRVAEKSGYTIFDRATYNGEPALFLERCEHPPSFHP